MATKCFHWEFPSLTFLTVHPSYAQAYLCQSAGWHAPVPIHEFSPNILKTAEEAGTENLGMVRGL